MARRRRRDRHRRPTPREVGRFASGESATLEWSVFDATSVSIDNRAALELTGRGVPFVRKPAIQDLVRSCLMVPHGDRKDRTQSGYVVTSTFDLVLPQGIDLNSFDTFTVWCFEFRTIIAEGKFRRP